ncbi:DNA repair protein RecN [Sporosarcina pasteurii]|uniref:DNA repair protein RecN n=1 Tax=Sporosarcina pasteurii TaxID=1474 RepID=A0A380BPH2_SPOPA|nr:DNA repair protein RecN [Sporosarcina pasteurii]MDS9471113.1 DNA repair protein RecN [Sporosarcina pasteurii]QBQ05245.1 DNA repair protein RecN [Sporosarcina pasteurii]SUJ04773.1 Recombination protein N [Sporosarcina pasteurii]
MLNELTIRNFAIIKHLDVSFKKGLTVLTGETGAGKSIIIDAVQLLAGGRGSQGFIRHGADRAELEGLFMIEDPTHPVLRTLENFGIQADEETIILRRDINANGKSVCRINGKLVTIAIMREVGASLIDIHGQHENQELMHERRHIHLLDQFAGKKMEKAYHSYTETYSNYTKLKKKLETANENEQQIAQRIDLYSFQLTEINNANLTIGEEEALEDEQRKLQNFSRLYERLNTAYEAISGDTHALDWVGAAMSDLEDATGVDKKLSPHYETVANSFYALQETGYELKNIIDDLEFDPARLNEVEERLALLLSLKRKYGQTIEDILLYRDKIADELDQLMNRDERLHADQVKLAQIMKDLEVEAEELSIIRIEAAKRLEAAIMEQLQQLHMEKASFKVMITQKKANEFDVNGYDEVAFHIATNVGEPLKPLVAVASGGELSRLMLALKTIFSKHQGVTSIIFDEVDTGVSGRVAQAIAEKIAMVARHSQVLCISHLPQVAAMADQHYLIKKEVKNERTMTSIENVHDKERTNELSRMLSGAETTELTLKHAEELLSLAAERKKTLQKM